jgi:class 3 adenylate cyclase
MEVERFRELGLYDPEAPNAADRLAVLGFLDDNGVTLDEMVEAHAKGRLLGLVGDRQLLGWPRLTLAEVAARSGVGLEQVKRINRAAGFPDPAPDDRAFGTAYVDVLRSFDAAVAIFGEDVTLQLTRVISSSLQRIAEAFIAAIQANVDAPLFESGASELDVARSSSANAQLLPTVVPVLDMLLRAHLEAANDRRFELSVRAAGTPTHRLAVGFADVVGFTALSGRLAMNELAAAVGDLDELATEIVTGLGGRVVKLIGDEIMFVAPAAAVACDIAVALVDRIDAHDVLPALRVGMSMGDVLARDGDYFGPVVNEASRVVHLADPGRIVVTRPVRDAAADDGLRFTSLGARRLRGFEDRVRLYRLSRARDRGASRRRPRSPVR